MQIAKPRVAFGVFHDAAGLLAALADLAAADSGGGDILVLSDSATLIGGTERFHPPAANDRSSRRVRLIVRNDGNPNHGWISFKKGGRRPRLAVDRLVRFDTWLAPRIAVDLENQLSRGCFLLISTTLDPAQDKSITEILLKHAADGVQLHDVGSAAD